MKKLLLLSLLLFSTALLSNELEWVDKQIDMIKPPRKGMDHKKLSHLHNPFVQIKFEQKKKTAKTGTTNNVNAKKEPNATQTAKVKKVGSKRKRLYLRLSMVMNNKAFINKKWYKLHSKVYGYKIVQITQKTVRLVRGKRTILLSTNAKSKKINFKND